MTLVLQTSNETYPETDDTIQRIITGHGLRQQESSVSFGAEKFTYFNIEEDIDTEVIINELMQLPNVSAAYLKPEGIPPI